MGISWVDLMSDELPNEVVEDYKIALVEEGLEMRRETDKK